MVLKSNWLIGIILLFAFGIVKTGYSQGDNSAPSSPSALNGYVKASLSNIPVTRVEVPNDKVLRKALADSIWKAITKYVEGDGKDLREQLIHIENYRFSYLQNGYKFWQMFPEDKRRYKWLNDLTSASVSILPNFWADIDQGARAKASAKGGCFYNYPIDTAAKKKWMDILNNCGSVYLNDPKVGKSEKSAYKVGLITRFITGAYNAATRSSEEAFFIGLDSLLTLAVEDLEEGSAVSSMLIWKLNNFLGGNTEYGISMARLKAFVNKYTQSSHDDIRKWALQKIVLLNADLKTFKLFDGMIKGIDIEKFNNKVVLVDFWNIYCSTCISRMYVVKPIFEKYHDRGFEVLSVSIDQESKKNRVDGIIKKVGANWDHMVIGGDGSASAPSKMIFNTYGFKAVPQLMMFNRKGKLVVFNGPLVFENDPNKLNDLIRILVEE